MKLNRITPYLFLSLLVCAQIAQTSLVTKTARNRLQSLNKNQAKSTRRTSTRSSTKFKTMNPENTMSLIEVLTDPDIKNTTKVIDIIMGIICEYVPLVCSIYQSLKDYVTLYEDLKTCFTIIETTVEDIGAAAKAVTNQVEVQDDFVFCKKVKAEIKITYQNNRQQVGQIVADNAIGSSFIPGLRAVTNMVARSNLVGAVIEPFVSSDAMCTSTNPVRVAQLKPIFGSMAEYKKECEYFAKKDCSKFDPSTQNLTNFMGSAWGIMKKVWESMACVIKNIRKVPFFDNLVTELVTWVGGGLLTSAISGVAHYLTMGVWGGIKAAYHLVRLGMKIHEVIKEYNKTQVLNLFNIGRCIGKAVNIVKSLIMGRRRKLKLKLRK